MNKKVTWYDAARTVPVDNHIYLMMVSDTDTTSNLPVIRWSSRLNYKDP